MKIGFDYWQVCSHYPEYFALLSDMFADEGIEVHVISALGEARKNTVRDALTKLNIGVDGVHEVLFTDPKESPELKLAKCQELGITVFYDDRDDVCRLLNKNGIIAMRVTYKDNSTYDLDAEQK